MPNTTQNCKDFITSIATLIGEDPQEQWKRIRKYKLDPYLLRDFQNKAGRLLTIGEYNDTLFLYTIGEPFGQEVSHDNSEENIVESLGMHYVGHKATLADLQSFISQCVISNPNIVYEDAYDDAIKPNSWDLIWDFIPLDDEDYEIGDHYLYYSTENLYIYDYPYKDREQFYCYIDRPDLYKIYGVFMQDYDTAYRINIYETKDHYLFLGLNDPD